MKKVFGSAKGGSAREGGGCQKNELSLGKFDWQPADKKRFPNIWIGEIQELRQ